MFAEQLIDAAVDFVDSWIAIAELLHIQTHLMVEGAGAEVEEVNHRLRLFHDAAIFLRRLQQQFTGLVQVRTVCNPNAQDHPGRGIGQRPVGELGGDEHLVGHDDLLAVKVGHRGGADTDLTDRAGEGAEGDHITDAHRAFKQDDEA